jgi:hypothetical protein
VGVGSDLFSSPGKQAQQSASAVQGIDQNEINQAEAYTGQAEQNERNAIAGIGTNPYFGGTSATAGNPNGSPIAAPQQLNPANPAAFGPTGVVSPATTGRRQAT